MTCAPARDSSSAIPLPTPLLAPVTSAIFDSSGRFTEAILSGLPTEPGPVSTENQFAAAASEIHFVFDALDRRAGIIPVHAIATGSSHGEENFLCEDRVN